MATELGQRAVAVEKHWRWMAGMLTLEQILPPAITLGWDPARVLHADPGDEVEVVTICGKLRPLHDGAVPDLTDPATLGCLRQLVREAWGAELDIIWWPRGTGKCVCEVTIIDTATGNDVGDAFFTEPTEADSLVAALEAAP